MLNKILVVAAAVLMLASIPHVGAAGTGTGVFVNGSELSFQQLVQFQAYYGALQPGNYWFDNAGRFGRASAPASSQSRGTGVFVNGYELTPEQLGQFQSYYGSLWPGQYWQDNYGRLGMVTQPWITSAGGGHVSGDGQGCVGFVWSDASYISNNC